MLNDENKTRWRRMIATLMLNDSYNDAEWWERDAVMLNDSYIMLNDSYNDAEWWERDEVMLNDSYIMLNDKNKTVTSNVKDETRWCWMWMIATLMLNDNYAAAER